MMLSNRLLNDKSASVQIHDYCMFDKILLSDVHSHHTETAVQYQLWLDNTAVGQNNVNT